MKAATVMVGSLVALGVSVTPAQADSSASASPAAPAGLTSGALPANGQLNGNPLEKANVDSVVSTVKQLVPQAGSLLGLPRLG